MTNDKYREYVQQMIVCSKMTDIEHGHATADELLIDFLKELGYFALAHQFDQMKKWYA